MNAVVIAFTERGALLARNIAEHFHWTAFAPRTCLIPGVQELNEGLAQWTEYWFEHADALIFVGACGIAVRAISPHVRHKAEDPAVVVLDEYGKYAISLLSGHLGGANDVSHALAAYTGGSAVITTSTDLNDAVAVDCWAKARGCAVENPEAIKHVSSAVLRGEEVGVAITEEIVDPPFLVTLWLRPRNLVLGIGCKKGVPQQDIQSAVADFLAGSGVSQHSLRAVASISQKKDEPGILDFCKSRGLAFHTYDAQSLSGVPGNFSASTRVLEAVGVDNVCERAAVLCSGGVLMRGKTRYPGITLALAKGGGDFASKDGGDRL